MQTTNDCSRYCLAVCSSHGYFEVLENCKQGIAHVLQEWFIFTGQEKTEKLRFTIQYSASVVGRGITGLGTLCKSSINRTVISTIEPSKIISVEPLTSSVESETSPSDTTKAPG